MIITETKKAPSTYSWSLHRNKTPNIKTQVLKALPFTFKRIIKVTNSRAMVQKGEILIKIRKKFK